MSIHIGLDVGAVSVKAALVLPKELAESILAQKNCGCELRMLKIPGDNCLAALFTRYRRTRGRPLEAVRNLLGELLDGMADVSIASIMLTGSGSGQARPWALLGSKPSQARSYLPL